MPGEAVTVTFAPSQIVVEGAETETEGTTLATIEIVLVLELTLVGLAQVALEVNST